ncbi:MULTISPECIES: NADH:ubiquinone reductase (Na(+)-transporting) subunit B [Methylophaga]|jgi:Na+-transporting NADH:ubiquinone oxidoreductase subunit B|uniref:Na(+)-translocating NADH-quinone reductase subunit B n=1 Tax=Methylophaga marina TaxID=45495 RepID=A0ABP3CUW2_9GAMM|nr:MULTISPECIES: NADH:ubiquinone reductase (Na(+)-transporting) subunit B [unclassified Methylophaga]MAX51905.1 NADH:ubiquinone reductase (Na(+)-transporting) subunit B [Methylophaga sp.]|tara:strand:+ start:5220 stop:6428 length:1209 start_codon:yes stop_codon:yes gene_type:complete
MARLRRFLDRIEPQFQKGGPYEKYFALYEMVDTFIYSPADVTRGSPHVRDAIDLKRVMSYVVVATFPVLLLMLWNTGFQANNAITQMGMTDLDGWRNWIMSSLGIAYDPNSLFANMFHGLLYFLPMYITTLVAGGVFEVIFAAVRNHEVNEGFLVSSMLYTLTLPPSTPLWMVALGIIFGVVLGKEVFGGTGKNFLNPALTGRAFLYFAYPAAMSGDAVWTAVDGYTGATPLALAASGGIDAVESAGYSWSQTFFGIMPGSLGETSTLAILIGAAFLIYTRVANFRIILGVFLGMFATTLLFNLIGSDTNPMFSVPWYWHLTMGGLAFGMVFMATDPVSAAMTNKGRWIYGALIGFMAIMIRVVNPAFPEGIMLAILFGNIFAPLIDYFVVQANIKRRLKRS